VEGGAEGRQTGGMSTLRRNAKGIGLMLLCSLCLCLGQLVWKLMPQVSPGYLLAGFAIYGVGAALMVIAYRFGEMSVLQPVNSVSYVYALLLAALVLHESFSAINVLGIAVVMAGVFVLAWSKS